MRTKEIIKIEVTVELSYETKEQRKEGIEDALRIVKGTTVRSSYTVLPQSSKLMPKRPRSKCSTCVHRPKPKSKREQAEEWANFMKTIND